MTDTRKLELAISQEIDAAIEFLAKHGYTVWHGGGRVVSRYEEKKRELERRECAAYRARMNEALK